MSRNLANSIEIASVNAILNYDKIEEATAQRMLQSLNALKKLEQAESVDDKYLIEFARDFDFFKVEIIKSDENKYSFLKIVDDVYLGFNFIPREPKEKYIAAIIRPKGGFYVAMVEAEELTNIQKETGITPLINSLVADSSLKYIAIQDTLGIIAATGNIKELSSIYSDVFLQKVQQEHDFFYRIHSFKDEQVYESVAPFHVMDTDYGLIRIGFDYRPITELNQVAIRNAIVRMLISGLVLLVLFAYSMITRRLQLVHDEKERITAEVYRLQEDIHRKEKLTAMGELAAGVAHEVRNPLNAISMSVQRLGKSLELEPASKEQKMISTIRNEINRIGEIIQQFLSFARPSKINKTKSNLNQIVKEALEIYHAKFIESAIVTDIEFGEIPDMMLDGEKIKQVIINLFENAIHAMQSGGKLSVKLEKTSSEILLKIRDTGIGISQENIEKIFNLYFTTKPEGNGLGLPQVYQIISNHNGRIDVKSEIDKFTEFTITFGEIK